jgi:hypothetical protein
MQDDVRNLLPRDKFDTPRAEAIVAVGYPAVAPVVPELLAWIQDGNWPVAQIIAPFLATIGAPLIPHIRAILATDDNMWKYWVLSHVVQHSPEIAAALREDLVRLANSPTRAETAEELDQLAQEFLRDLR